MGTVATKRHGVQEVDRTHRGYVNDGQVAGRETILLRSLSAAAPLWLCEEPKQTRVR